MKHALLICVLAVFFGGMRQCAAADENSGKHNLTVTSGQTTINSFPVLSDASTDRSELFKPVFTAASDPASDIPYVKLREKIKLDFGSALPDRLTLKDRVIDDDGTFLYLDQLTTVLTPTVEEDCYVFLLDVNATSLLHAQMGSFRTQFRGFELTATWGDKEETFAFVVQTKAH